MQEKPILFSGEMVRAILEGRKTQTRRIVKPNPDIQGHWREWTSERMDHWLRMSPYQIGDHLWVRETWFLWDAMTDEWEGDTHDGKLPVINNDNIEFWRRRVEYRADRFLDDTKYRPSIFMPRWASRLTLEITSVGVERLQEITDTDAIAEGVIGQPGEFCAGVIDRQTVPLPTDPALCAAGEWRNAAAFRCLWDKINGKRAPWVINPWVWVVKFKRVDS